MRHLITMDIASTLRRGKSVEQFIGQSPVESGYIRHVELRPSDGEIEVWIFDVEDVGSEDYLDLYAFPYLDPDQDVPVAIFPNADAALEYASASLTADPSRWVNLGVAQSEYLDFIQAGRPPTWPVA